MCTGTFGAHWNYNYDEGPIVCHYTNEETENILKMDYACFFLPVHYPSKYSQGMLGVT